MNEKSSLPKLHPMTYVTMELYNLYTTIKFI